MKQWSRANRHRLRFLKPLWSVSRTALRALPLHFLPSTGLFSPRPAGFHESVAAYLTSGSRHKLDRTIALYPTEDIERELPETFGRPLPKAFSDHVRARVPAAGVHVLHDVRFWGHYGGSVIGRDNRLLGDVSPDVWTLKRHKALGCIGLPPVKTLSGTVAVIATAEAESNYWHWMMDAVPRLHLLEKAGYPPDKVDWYLTNARMTSFQRETLAAIGLPENKLVMVNDHTHLKLDTAIVPSIRPASWDVPSWIPHYLNKLPIGTAGQNYVSELLFLSRAGEATRRLTCEAELVPELEKRGFIVAQPGNWSVAEQKAVFAVARLVVAPHGAALTNLVFCQPGTVVLDLMSATWPGLYFWGLASAQNVTYSVLVDGSSDQDGTQRTKDITLTRDQVLYAVDSILPALNSRALRSS
jgi:capsular polysaccharide biosynthesis protein